MLNKKHNFFIINFICSLFTPYFVFGIGQFIGTCNDLIPCEIGTCSLEKHIPILVLNVLKCILWTISPLYLIFLIIYSGIFIYLSFGKAETMANIKKKWMTFWQGWVIILLSWTIINFFYKLIL